MSEHRRKPPMSPELGGRAAARRAAQLSSSRHAPEHSVASLAPEPETTSTRRFPRYLGRSTMAGILLASSGALVLHEEPPKQQAVPVATSSVPHTVYRTGGDGVWLHESPGMNTPLKVVMPDGATFNVDCFVPGGDMVHGNAVWLEGDYNGTHGAVTDYYIDTHWNTTQDFVDQGIEQCGTNPNPPGLENRAPQQPAQPNRIENGGSVFYSPWDGGESPATYTMVYEGEEGRKWKSDTMCAPERANDFPEVVDGKRITTLSGWSKGRLGPIYFLESATEQQKDNINYILLIDPGDKAEYNGGCNDRIDFTNDPMRRRNQSQTLADWLRQDPNNQLTILSGEVTYDEGSINDGYAHQGIQETLFAPAIRGNADITDQVVICNYNAFGHQSIFRAFRNYMNRPAIASEDMCPRSSEAGGQFDGAWRP